MTEKYTVLYHEQRINICIFKRKLVEIENYGNIFSSQY